MSEAVLVGVGQTPFCRNSEVTDEEFLADAIRLGLADAGMEKDAVDGLAIGTMSLKDDSPLIAEHLGFELGWVLKADYGGAAGVAGIARARQAIEAGYVDVVVLAAGGNRNPMARHDLRYNSHDYSRRSWAEPFGYGGPNGFFGMIQRRHMEEYGTTLEQLGKIATTFRAHARLNPEALLRGEMSIEDYINSRPICDPIRLLDCAMPCCGAAAVVLASSERARTLEKMPVRLGSYAEVSGYQSARSLPDRLETGFAKIKDRLFAEVDREELDFLQLYDDYPVAILMTLEDLGFTEKGNGGPFVEGTDISVGGTLPINTGGGQLSMGQPEMAGGFIHIIEAVRQLRGEAGDRQLPNPRQGLVTGIGLLSCTANLAITSGMVLKGGQD